MPDKTGLQVVSFPRRVLGAVLCVCEREARASLPKGASVGRFGCRVLSRAVLPDSRGVKFAGLLHERWGARLPKGPSRSPPCHFEWQGGVAVAGQEAVATRALFVWDLVPLWRILAALRAGQARG